MEKRLFVGNLPYSVGESELEAAFAEHGTVVSSVVIRDRESGRSRGFGFIEMETEEMAESAAGALGWIRNGWPPPAGQCRATKEQRKPAALGFWRALVVSGGRERKSLASAGLFHL